MSDMAVQLVLKADDRGLVAATRTIRAELDKLDQAVRKTATGLEATTNAAHKVGQVLSAAALQGRAAIQKSTQALETYREGLALEIKLAGISEKQRRIELKTQALLEKAAKNKIAYTRKQAQEEARYEREKRFRNFVGEVDGGFRDAFRPAFFEGEKGWDQLLEKWKDKFRNMRADMAFPSVAELMIIPTVSIAGGSVFAPPAPVPVLPSPIPVSVSPTPLPAPAPIGLSGLQQEVSVRNALDFFLSSASISKIFGDMPIPVRAVESLARYAPLENVIQINNVPRHGGGFMDVINNGPNVQADTQGLTAALEGMNTRLESLEAAIFQTGEAVVEAVQEGTDETEQVKRGLERTHMALLSGGRNDG